jgi:hypothetical protein
MRLVTSLIVFLLVSGCATQNYMLSGFSDIPETCKEIDAELLEAGVTEALWQNIRLGRDGAVTGIGIAAAVGLVPSGYGWLPLAGSVLQLISPPSKADRIYHLALVREIRKCGPLNVTKNKAN